MPPKKNDTNPAQRGLKILFVDDEPKIREVMRRELPRLGHRVAVCENGTTAIAAIEANVFDCLLVDLDMPDIHGMEVIDRAKELSPDTDAIILTGKGTMEAAVRAIRCGVFDFLTKPYKLTEVRSVLDRVTQHRELKKRYEAARRRLDNIEGGSDLIGQSEVMDRVRRRIEKIAPTSSTVLILGETGTGKELVARALHDRSSRCEAPFVAVNCGALPENLIESELFGHRQGAFTGAEEHRTGLFEVADGGTLFLDEIGETPPAVQAKLLRFLEQGEIRRLGENESFTCDVRVVSATNRPLDDMVNEERFRRDLLFRINTFEILLPALRERVEDIPELVLVLAERIRALPPKIERLFDEEATRLLSSYSWPGNVRELANVIEHAMILGDEFPLTIDSLPSRLLNAVREMDGRDTVSTHRFPDSPPLSLREMELEAVHCALERHDGNKTEAAKELGISVKTLYNKLNQESGGRRAA